VKQEACWWISHPWAGLPRAARLEELPKKSSVSLEKAVSTGLVPQGELLCLKVSWLLHQQRRGSAQKGRILYTTDRAEKTWF